MPTSYAYRLWSFIRNPVVRLDTQMPWSLKKIGGIYAVSLLYYFVGSLVPALGIMVLFQLLDAYYPSALEWFFYHFGASSLAMATVMVITFLSGFGAQMWYFNKKLKDDGFSFRRAVGLNLDSFQGGFPAAFKVGFIVFLIGIAVSTLLEFIPMPEIKDPAIDLIKSMDGWAFFLLALLIVLVGPALEEIVFRGLLYGSLRAGLATRVVSQEKRDALAAVVSASAFALLHLNPSGFLIYFGLGYVFAEAYRRTGSLYPSIIAHCLNNGFGILVFLNSAG